MPRPTRCRRVACQPGAYYFKPRGVPCSCLKVAQLTLDEFEAIRLADLEGFYQEDSAARMGISRQTFGNIIAAAHRKVADALVNAKALKIVGGAVTAPELKFACRLCRHHWQAKPGGPAPSRCPQCKTQKIRCLTAGPQKFSELRTRKKRQPSSLKG